MKKILFFIIFCSPLIVFPQCKDSLCQPNAYAYCGPVYSPVCACDGKTYRNFCVAEVGACISSSGHVDGPCGDFDIDLYPNMIDASPSGVGHLSIYMKYPGTALITIYNSMGNLEFEKSFSTNEYNTLIPGADPYDLYEAQAFQRGVYILVVTVGGSPKTVKFIKVDNGK